MTRDESLVARRRRHALFCHGNELLRPRRFATHGQPFIGEEAGVGKLGTADMGDHASDHASQLLLLVLRNRLSRLENGAQELPLDVLEHRERAFGGRCGLEDQHGRNRDEACRCTHDGRLDRGVCTAESDDHPSPLQLNEARLVREAACETLSSDNRLANGVFDRSQFIRTHIANLPARGQRRVPAPLGASRWSRTAAGKQP